MKIWCVSCADNENNEHNFVSRFYGRNFSITGIIATFRQAEQRDGKRFQMRHSTNKLAMQTLRTLMEIAVCAAFCIQFKFIWYSQPVFIKVQFTVKWELAFSTLLGTWNLSVAELKSVETEFTNCYYFALCAICNLWFFKGKQLFASRLLVLSKRPFSVWFLPICRLFIECRVTDSRTKQFFIFNLKQQLVSIQTSSIKQ